MVTVEINVTKKDIGEGVCADAGNCPIARAALRTGFKEVDVSGYELGFGYGTLVHTKLVSYYDDNGWAKLPKAAKNFVEAFDAREPVKPFTFRIRLKNSLAKQLKLRKSAIVST